MPTIPFITQKQTDRPLVKVVNLMINNPAAGEAFVYVIPVGYRTRLVSLFFQLVCDANVADRFVTFTINSPSGIVWRTSHTVAVTATQTSTWQFHNGTLIFAISPTNLNFSSPFPSEITLEEGDFIQIAIAGIQVGDQLSLINMHLISQFVAE